MLITVFVVEPIPAGIIRWINVGAFHLASIPLLKQAQRLTFSPRQARLLGGEQSDSAPDAVAVSPEAIDAIQSLLRLARDGGPLPVITRAQADAANRLLALHVQEQTASRLRTARYVLP